MIDAAKPDCLRLFVAIELPNSVKDAILRAQDRMKITVKTGNIRWARREQFHITLKFLGNVAAPYLEDLKGALTRVCETFAPVKLSAEGVGYFPNPRSPRVVWVGVTASQGELSSLHQAVQNATRRFTTEADEKPFSGHITMCRVKQLPGSEARLLSDSATNLQSERFGEWTSEQAVLLASELHPEGSRYTVVTPLRFNRHQAL